MTRHIEATAPDGLNRQGGSARISVAGGTPLKYHFSPETSTPQSYSVAKIQSRFQLRIETARVICRLAGIGGAHV